MATRVAPSRPATAPATRRPNYPVNLFSPPLRNPLAYVPNGVVSTQPVSMAQGEWGIRKAQQQIPRPATAAPAYKRAPDQYPHTMPLRTAGIEAKLYDVGSNYTSALSQIHQVPAVLTAGRVTFPRGDIGAQMLVRKEPKRDGDKWAKKTPPQSVREIGTSAKCRGVRAYVSPYSPAILYQCYMPPPARQ